MIAVIVGIAIIVAIFIFAGCMAIEMFDKDDGDTMSLFSERKDSNK